MWTTCGRYGVVRGKGILGVMWGEDPEIESCVARKLLHSKLRGWTKQGPPVRVATVAVKWRAPPSHVKGRRTHPSGAVHAQQR